ncbi:hypothetical protein Tco_1044356 [Tanacetum coccineum]|uniref:Retrovirus-related Pol polyprotein from transposon TNT 1-94-like beta-barrel domain-containing protein n=1 Tax=Tanacetum coccineum TaxID=301880 RepID=A0ABQ5GPP6_9ASTR
MCIKYASDADSASDGRYHPLSCHGVFVAGELLPTGLGWVNVTLPERQSREIKQATGLSLEEPTHLDYSKLDSYYFYCNSCGLETVSGLVLHMFVDKRYPLSVNLIKRMLDHQLEICRDTVVSFVRVSLRVACDYICSLRVACDYISSLRVACDYISSELGHFARECTGKQVDSKARYSLFKLQELNKGEETKALLSVDSMVNWSDHEGEDVEIGAAQVYGMIAGAEEDATGNATGDVADGVSNAAAEFALMGISSQVQTCPFGCEHLYAELKMEFNNVEGQYKECYIQVQAYKSNSQTLEQQKGWYQSNQLALEERIRILNANLENTTNMLKYTEKLNEQAKLEKMNDKVKLEESNARFDKWKDSSKNLDKLINSSMSSRSKFGLGFGDTFGSNEVFDLSAPSIFDSSPKDGAEKPLYDRFVKAVGMNDVPPPITGTFMPPSNNPDLDDTQFTYGSKSNNYSETNSVSNDFVSCDNSDKSSDSETTDFASCVSSVKSSSSKTNDPLASAPSSVDYKPVSKTADQQSNSTNDDSSFSFKENVKPPRNLCNKSGINSRSLCKRKSFGSKTCFVYGSKFHLIKDCDFYEKQLELHNKPMWTNVANIPSFVPKAASVPAGSRNRPTYVPAGSRNRPTSVPAGRPFTAGWKNHAARHMTRPSSHYFQHFSRPGGDPRTMENPHKNRDLGIIDSGCSRSMTGNKEKLDDFVKIVGGTVTFGGGDGKITGKGTIRTSKLNFENNKVLFTDKECLVLSKEFQPPENSQVVLRVPRRNNLYCFNLSDIKPERDVTCLLAKASLVCIKKIFKYLKGQPKLGLWYPRDSPFVLEAYNDSDYASSHEAENDAAAKRCGQFPTVALLDPTGRTILLVLLVFLKSLLFFERELN